MAKIEHRKDKDWMTLQREFLESVMGVDMPPEATKTSYFNDELFMLHLNLIMEEMKELHVELTYSFQDPSPENYANLLKEMVDVIYVIIGMANNFNMPLNEAFRAVHEANMSKVDDEGNVIRDANGKVLKPEGYKEANVINLFGEVKH